jgi:hypothetical protein
MPSYPETEKLRHSNIKDLRRFMVWLTEERDQAYELAYFEPGCKWLTPANAKSEDLILEFLGIDKEKLEEERRQMLADMEKHHESHRSEQAAKSHR